ncbi:MAG: STAS domain-containing protein [Nitrososphaerales archaeon]
MDLTVTVEETTKGYVLIELAGDMDAFASKEFTNVVEDLIKRRKHNLIVDTAKVTYIDSVGARALLAGLKKTLENKGDLCLIHEKSPVGRFLAVAGLDKKFKVFKTRHEASQQLRVN